MRRLAVVALLLAFLFSLSAAAAGAPLVRVLLAERSGPVTIEMPGAHRGFVDGAWRFETPLGLSWPLQAVNGRLTSEGRVVGQSFTLEPLDGVVAWEGRHYRGSLQLVADGEKLLVINVVELESYLRGVVPAEMQASWPLEALKAQAVAARTYTLGSLDPEAAYDLCATIDCQVYRGMEVEHPRSDQAIAETAGVVLTYGGDFARTYYHADSGGVLASSAEVWGRNLPYLQARSDVESNSPYRRWDRRLEPQAMASSLRALGLDVGRVEELRILGYSESGRVIEAEVSGSSGRVTLSGGRLRDLLRSWGLRSTRFRMTGPLSVRGEGWGHGVGMSQYGARGLAEANYQYSQILAFYYPDTSLQRLVYRAAAP